MASQDALDDLRAIRQIMEQARRSSDGFGGWFMVLWGVIWLVGFAGTQILLWAHRSLLVGRLWLLLDSLGVVGSVYLGLQLRRRARKKSASRLWGPIFLWWLALAAFDGVLTWLFRLQDFQFALLIVLTIALGYIQFGLFTHWIISAVGLFIGLLAVLLTTCFPGSFSLGIALLGGAALIGGGLWAIRQGK